MDPTCVGHVVGWHRPRCSRLLSHAEPIIDGLLTNGLLLASLTFNVCCSCVRNTKYAQQSAAQIARIFPWVRTGDIDFQSCHRIIALRRAQAPVLGMLVDFSRPQLLRGLDGVSIAWSGRWARTGRKRNGRQAGRQNVRSDFLSVWSWQVQLAGEGRNDDHWAGRYHRVPLLCYRQS